MLAAISNRVLEIYSGYEINNRIKIDRLFKSVLYFQWIAILVIAYCFSPLTWSGTNYQIHPHIYIAIISGLLFTLTPVYFLSKKPGQETNILIVTIAQFAYTVIIIHITGGRIESHFHVFGSLAFLALYRSPKPIILFTALTAADHLIRGYLWPQSVYGVLSSTPWRTLEHVAWVLFEDSVLIYAILQNINESRELANRQFQIERTLNEVENIVNERTQDLEKSNQLVLEQQEKLVINSKMSALGEMAGGVAHEVNTPLAVIQIQTDLIREIVENSSDERCQKIIKKLDSIDSTLNRISKIISGLRSFARDNSKNDEFIYYKVNAIIEDVLVLCNERLKNKGIDLRKNISSNFDICCHPIQISQILLNFIANSCDAIENLNEKWILIEATQNEKNAIIAVTDSGNGIPKDIKNKIMQPFFTTKELGKGTGLGLSISKGIAESHGGRIYVDDTNKNTCLVIEIPLQQKNIKSA